MMDPTNFSWPCVGNCGSLPYPSDLSLSISFSQYYSAAMFLILTLASLILGYLSACPYRKQLFTAQKRQAGGTNTVPFVPYWIPYLGVSCPFLNAVLLAHLPACLS